MLFGKSIFQSVVERLAEEAEDEAEEPGPPVYRVSGLSAGFVAESIDQTPVSATLMDAYLALMPEERAVANEPPVIPPHLLRLTIAEIAEDLGITETEDRQSLAEKRRAFARDNHPDRHPADFRDKATARMKIANLLIDEALKRCG